MTVDLKAHSMQDIAFALLRIQEELSRKTVVMQQQLQALSEKLEVLWDIGSMQDYLAGTLFKFGQGRAVMKV